MNQRELSEVFGVSQQTLWEWQGEDGFPILVKARPGEENQYDTAEVFEWRVNRAIRKVTPQSQRDRLTALQADMLQIQLAEKNGTMVSAAEVEPVWTGRVRAAAAFMLGRASRLAGILETTEGLEAKREVLRKEDANFLSHLGVNGEAIQIEVDALLAKVSEQDASAFMQRMGEL